MTEKEYEKFCQQFWAFNEAMFAEYEKAREKFEPFHSMHEGFAVLLEEVEELKQQTFMQTHRRNRKEIIQECVQIATMAACIALECLEDVTREDLLEQ